MVRAKMLCNSVERTSYGKTHKDQVRVKMGVVYSSDPASENRAFSDATPTGNVDITIQGDKPAALMFEPGKHYYVDFTDAPD